MDKIKIIVFEDNFHLRESLYFLINGESDLTCEATYPDVKNLESALNEYNPDIVLMDIEMPGMNGIDATRKIKKLFPSCNVLIQTVFQDDNHIFEAICAGASGYLLKSAGNQAYLTAIRDVYSGGSPMSGPVARRVLELFQRNLKSLPENAYELTQKEKDVLSQLVEGKSFKMIADQLNISYETVRSHMKNIYSKLHVHSNTEAVIKAIREKLV